MVEGKQIDPFAVNRREPLVDPRAGRTSDRLRTCYLRPRPRTGTSPAQQTSSITAMLPRQRSTHTASASTPPTSGDQQLLCGLFNSFVLNYLVRLRVSTYVTTALVERLPVPTREHAPRAAREIAALARALSRRPDPVAAARLQARVAALYQLTIEEFDYVLSTFPLVPQEIRDAAMTAYATGISLPTTTFTK